MSEPATPRTEAWYALTSMSKFDGVKVFSATMFGQREQLGETVTAWISANPRIELVDVVITQSSDAQFHCIAITVFYKGTLGK